MWQHCIVILKNFYLQRNKISKLHPGAFANLPELISLELDHNKLTEIHPEIWGGHYSIMDLSLENNNISTLHPGAFANLPSSGDFLLVYEPIDNFEQEGFSLHN